jgi:type IV secretion system protein VirB9
MTVSRLTLLAATALILTPSLAGAKGAHQRTKALTVRPADVPRTRDNILRANEEARMHPDRGSYFNAIQKYAFVEGALFQIYTAPGQITDLVLEKGEELVGPGPIAAGDTVRWIIGDSFSGIGPARKVHILVKPTRADIRTNLIINTNRRTYYLELHATPATYMASVSWTYPSDGLVALHNSTIDTESSPSEAIDVNRLNFRYKISGDKTIWRPERVFDDGRQIFIAFPATVVTSDMPPLFVLDAGKTPELVNYRVRGRYIIVDRLFARAELRLATGKSVTKIRIERQGDML